MKCTFVIAINEIKYFCKSIINRAALKAKNLHLLVSILIIVPVGLAYGLMPNGFLENIFQFKFESIGLAGIFRALMGLYIGMSIFWLIGIIKPKCWTAATLSNVLFMTGLAFGRIVSILLDGIPSTIFLAGLIVEILLAVWGIINLKKYNSK